MRYLHAALCALVLAPSLRAANLPGALAPAEIDRVVELVGTGATTRIIRSGEPYELWPGLKVGMEIAVVPSHDVNLMGDQLGSLPAAIPVPRLFLVKGLAFNLELAINFFPFSLVNSISTFGGSLKWSFLDEAATFMHGAAFFSFTNISAFDRTYSGSNIEIGGVISKDYVRLKPYLGAGILFAKGSVNPGLARTSDNTGSHSTLHGFLGAEIELPVDVGFQLDLMNLSPSGSIFFGKKF